MEGTFERSTYVGIGLTILTHVRSHQARLSSPVICVLLIRLAHRYAPDGQLALQA